MSNSFQRGRKKVIQQPSTSKLNHTTLYSNHILSKQVNYKPKNKYQRSSSLSSSSNEKSSKSQSNIFTCLEKHFWSKHEISLRSNL